MSVARWLMRGSKSRLKKLKACQKNRGDFMPRFLELRGKLRRSAFLLSYKPVFIVFEKDIEGGQRTVNFGDVLLDLHFV